MLRDLTKLLNGLGHAVGDKGEALADLVAQSTSLINKLSKKSGDIRVALEQTDRLVQTLSDRQSTLTDSLAAAGPAVDVIAANTDDILALVDKVGAISTTLSTFLRSRPERPSISRPASTAFRTNSTGPQPIRGHRWPR